ncbi:FAD dependent oxidoreductase [Parathielavia hyrcaniae]|uniref:FAD dependent oxidoreductase n=1 Tax=Parathielavia hyrcaniae TaxID=113614 RepID=A0AAN6T154_9PEZI|nr:FAD dependent oxidoreductase [Parathielavia hyrcaniae]
MDERAKIPVSLPHPNPTVSYWQDPPDPIADHRTTPDLPSSADTVIIGSGITGAAVAWNLLQGANPGAILMFEARQACSGATGRNGGHTKHASYRTFPSHLAAHGAHTAVQIARLEHANMLAVHAFARDRGIDCDLHACPTVDVVLDGAEWESAQASVAAVRAAFQSPGQAEAGYTLYSAAEVRERFHVRHEDGVFGGREEKVLGGTNTAVTGLTRRKEGGKKEGGFCWEVQTPRGIVRARRVVLATNGYTAAVWPRFQGAVVPLRGQVTAQRPGRAMPAGGCLPTTYSFIYDKGYEYMVARPQGSRFAGDIVMGGGLVRAPDNGLMEFGTTDDSVVNEDISGYLREATGRYFGSAWGEDHPEERVRSDWTGIMGFSPDGFPFVGEVPGEKGLWASCGFQGHGMVLCWMCARALVDMMEGRDGEQLREWFPDVFRINEERLAKRFRGRLY